MTNTITVKNKEMSSASVKIHSIAMLDRKLYDVNEWQLVMNVLSLKMRNSSTGDSTMRWGIGKWGINKWTNK